MLHLAVFPVEVEFLRPVDHETVFYFEKGNILLIQVTKLQASMEKPPFRLTMVRKERRKEWLVFKIQQTFMYTLNLMLSINGAFIKKIQLEQRNISRVVRSISKTQYLITLYLVKINHLSELTIFQRYSSHQRSLEGNFLKQASY